VILEVVATIEREFKVTLKQEKTRQCYQASRKPVPIIPTL